MARAIRKDRVSKDDAEIRGLVAAWSAAVENKDIHGLVAGYGTDPLLFDAIPPFRTRGIDAIRETWERCL